MGNKYQKIKKGMREGLKIGLTSSLFFIAATSGSNTTYDMKSWAEHTIIANKNNESTARRYLSVADMDLNHYWGTSNNAELSKYYAIRSVTGIVGTAGSFYLACLSLGSIKIPTSRKESELEEKITN